LSTISIKYPGQGYARYAKLILSGGTIDAIVMLESINGSFVKCDIVNPGQGFVAGGKYTTKIYNFGMVQSQQYPIIVAQLTIPTPVPQITILPTSTTQIFETPIVYPISTTQIFETPIVYPISTTQIFETPIIYPISTTQIFQVLDSYPTSTTQIFETPVVYPTSTTQIFETPVVYPTSTTQITQQ
jgi:hypothetical protein